MTREEHQKIVDAVINAHKDNEMGGKYAKAFNHGVQSAFNRVCKALKDIEQQPNRCDSCTHSEEQDGSNCYECVKGMTDNFEAQPTNMRDATEEERKSVKDYVESISKPTGVRFEAQPCEDAVSRSELQKTMDSLTVFSFVNNGHEEAEDYYNCESVDMVIRNLPSVTPKYTDEEIDKAQAVEQAYVDKMVELAVEESRKKWLNSFDTSSATKCFEAVNLLKERLENNGKTCEY